MALKAKKNREPISDPNGMFAGMVVFLVEDGVQRRRLEIWKQKLVQMGATIADRLSKKVSHVFAANKDALLRQVGREHMERFKGNVLQYQWLEDCLRLGDKISEDLYILTFDLDEQDRPGKTSEIFCQPSKSKNSCDDEAPLHKMMKSSQGKNINEESRENKRNSTAHETSDTVHGLEKPFHTPSPENSGSDTLGVPNKAVSTLNSSLPYCPPDLNKNITDVFGKLINIYRALGDDRRSFSYYKAIGVVEKLPFKIESADQVKDLPTIGKSMQDHIQEIVTTGKLSKLEHFETDEKVLQDSQ